MVKGQRICDVLLFMLSLCPQPFLPVVEHREFCNFDVKVAVEL
jgi:hypothetical protein